MRKLTAILATLLLFCIGIAHAEIFPPDIGKIIQRGVLRIGVLATDASPFSLFSANGTLEGYDIDMANDLARKLGVPAVFKTAPTFDRLIDMVNDGELDLATNMTPTLARAKFTIFSNPYLTIKLVFFVNRVTASQRNLSADNLTILNNPAYRIGVSQNSAYYTILKELYPQSTLVPYPDITQAIPDVLNNKIMAAFLDQPHIRYWLRHHPQSNLYGEVIDSGKKMPIAFAVSWQNTRLLTWLNIYLDTIQIDGTQERWIKKYFPEKS